jgi:sulfur carrier protein ThiS
VGTRITLKLFATLGDYLPRELGGHVAVGHELPVDVDDATAVEDVIERFKLPRHQVHLVLVNGRYVPPALRPSHLLRPGDALAIWPPIAGG